MRLFEVFQHGEGQVVIAWQKDVWVYDDHDSKIGDNPKGAQLLELLDHLTRDRDVYSFPDESTAIFELVDFFQGTSSLPVLVGMIDGNSFLLDDTDINFRHSSTSSTLKHVMNHFNLDRVYVTTHLYDDIMGTEFEIEVSHSREELLKPLKDKTFYHGTSILQLNGILNKGLRPISFTNYPRIHHEDKIFITTNKERAMHHAQHASRKSDNNGGVVIELKVPDVNKLVLDYDVAIDYYGIDHPLTISLGYADVFQRARGGHRDDPELYKSFVKQNINKESYLEATDKWSLNTKLGLFGYKGRIPPTHIEAVHVDPSAIVAFVQYLEFGEIGDIGHGHTLANAERFEVDEYKEQYEQVQQQMEEELRNMEEEEVLESNENQ